MPETKEEMLDRIYGKPSSQLPSTQRYIQRNFYNKPTCVICGSQDHYWADCKQRGQRPLGH